MTESTQDPASKSLLGAPGPARTAVIWLIVLTAISQLVSAGAIGLVVGEAYYLSSARQLLGGYFDQPPISLWIIWAIHTLFHTQAAWLLRLPFVLIFAGATWLLYRIGARFRSEWTGFFAALVMNISVLFTLSIGTWVQPDAPLVLFWLATTWVLITIFFDNPTPADATRQWIWRHLARSDFHDQVSRGLSACRALVFMSSPMPVRANGCSGPGLISRSSPR